MRSRLVRDVAENMNLYTVDTAGTASRNRWIPHGRSGNWPDWACHKSEMSERGRSSIVTLHQGLLLVLEVSGVLCV